LIEEALGEGHDDTKNDILMLRKEGQRCARIVQGILNFARENEPSYVPFDLSMLISETLELLSHRIDSSEIKVITDIDDELIMEGDAGMIQQVLVNILLNAIQASAANAEITINAKKQNTNLIVEIIDQGEGIQGHNFSKIFDPFFTTKSEGEGTGLGLSISYGIIKHHGGSITLSNMEETGVKVTITLPEKCEIVDKELDYLEAKYVG
jgi:two-component system NtrC family sensor kinase